MVKMERKPRDLRFGNLVNEPDEIKKGQYVPWARKQKPGGVKEITFQAESRRAYLTGFRKRKTERSKVAKKNIVDKEAREKRKERNEKKRELMLAYEARQKRMKAMNAGLDPDNEDAEDDDEDEAEEEEEEEDDNATMQFFDNQSGSATTVEVAEMNLDEIHSVSVSASTLPALPKPEKPLGRKKKREGKGRARQVKKDRLQKSKRAKHQGGRGGG